jgi:hypothetical protein
MRPNGAGHRTTNHVARQKALHSAAVADPMSTPGSVPVAATLSASSAGSASSSNHALGHPYSRWLGVRRQPSGRAVSERSPPWQVVSRGAGLRPIVHASAAQVAPDFDHGQTDFDAAAPIASHLPFELQSEETVLASAKLAAGQERR